MGVYIPNMERPKDCDKCFVNELIELGGDRIFPTYCRVLKRDIKDDVQPTDCPLIDLDIVRCGECKWWDYETSGCVEIHQLAPFRELDFCSYGERKE